MANREKPLRILSLDGGGVRGLSSLLILRSIMENIAKEKKDGTSVDSMRPCDYFDCITGAGIGGVIALLLGRLKLTMLECTVEYRMLSSLKYREESISPLFDINDFISICNRITKKYEISDILQEPGNEGPLTFVYAMAKNKKLQCLRTYPSTDDSIDPERTPISTVMAALMTARGLFTEVSLNGEFGDKITFLDQPYPWSFSNPIIEAVTEAQGRTKGAEIGVIVSIGTGDVAKDDIQDLALLGHMVIYAAIPCGFLGIRIVGLLGSPILISERYEDGFGNTNS
ncbi:patatin-like phospholipase [Fusarium acutatum]|uniref:Patatin-like phospholipase n=1 Tax=Fusarium acutatum TaxID=78861 RepID=A0A8H4K4J6_9HYPO|nr:patatin-like phospholipase [Fusarium acutatum]